MRSAATCATAFLTSALAASAVSGYALPFQSNSSAGSDSASAARSLEDVEPRALPFDASAGSIKLPLRRQYGDFHPDINKRDPAKLGAWALRQKEYVEAKYGLVGAGDQKKKKKKRQTTGLTDVGLDSYYFAQVSVGIPKQNFNIILDTGSSDFWLVDKECGFADGCADDLNKYDSSVSSTSTTSTTPFSIRYGTGAVSGTLATETVSLAGYSVDSLTFAQANRLASNTIDAPASGIMGMGFESLASSGATPFWEVLAKQGKLQTNAFTFQLARNIDKIDIKDPNANDVLNPGGVFTLGQVDPNQYSGDITYIDIPNNLETQQGLGYWSIPLQGISVNGQSANIAANQLAAIDTGTTLIGGPASSIAAIYAQIPGSRYRTDMPGFYTFPCDSNVNVEFTFGGKNFKMSTADTNLGNYPYVFSTGCLGSFFSVDLGSDAYGVPQWIVGDSFLKNVFSVYQYSPARVGFASLKGDTAQVVSVTSDAVPSATSTTSSTYSSQTTTRSAVAGGGGLPTTTGVSAGPVSGGSSSRTGLVSKDVVVGLAAICLSAAVGCLAVL
ncbi:acid protease [Violaceomyces palustris]|uniref:Acid protease n=1 Tax=Violaceomyces palustris TaxID=1673888 RepID=A0ACD0NNR0_9BASI|nr:acid protease [Violaceomyces palustris]